VPYLDWVKSGHLIPIGGKVIEYEQVAEHLASVTKDMNIHSIGFDRWRMDLFKKEALKAGIEPALGEEGWVKIGQGFKDMSPCLETVETLLMNGKLRHGDHPLLNNGAANAIAVQDPARNRKLEKAKSTGRIDPLVAMVMSVHCCVAPADEESGETTADDFLIL
jgi:phage terminase large subunit-like protein